jgi:hypothetical protein
MVAIITKRRVGRPKATAVGVGERIERYHLAEKCAEFTDEIIGFWVSVLRNKQVPVYINGKPLRTKSGQPVTEDKYTVEQQFQASDRLMERAYGRPIQVMDVDQTTREQSIRRIEVRWLPPDPRDTSKHIEQEPD